MEIQWRQIASRFDYDSFVRQRNNNNNARNDVAILAGGYTSRDQWNRSLHFDSGSRKYNAHSCGAISRRDPNTSLSRFMRAGLFFHSGGIHGVNPRRSVNRWWRWIVHYIDQCAHLKLYRVTWSLWSSIYRSITLPTLICRRSLHSLWTDWRDNIRYFSWGAG